MIIPIFPLDLCLLPQGYSQLRIFEPRYHRLVSESLKSGDGFGLCMYDSKLKHLFPIGTLCKIIDFENLDDGLLGITIEGNTKFKINSISVDEHGLRHANVEQINDWPSVNISEDFKADNLADYEISLRLSSTLKKLLSQYPQHLSRYKDECFDDIAWVCKRWLEIIPLTLSQKYQCINNFNHKPAQSMLAKIIQ